MRLFKDKIAVMIMGAPGSGKGTQAELLSKKLDLFHFDTGRFLRKTLYSPRAKNNKEIQRERKLNEAGKLNTPSWVLKIVSGRVREISKLGQSLIFSGSPRTEFEAFGDSKNKGLIEALEKEYGKKNIFVFSMDVSEEDSIKRNKKRMSCSVCATPIMSGKKKAALCPFCGGKLSARKDDNEETIKKRFEVYDNETLPILDYYENTGADVSDVDGIGEIEEIHQRIVEEA